MAILQAAALVEDGDIPRDDGLLNPGKMFPELHRCAELGKMHVHHGKLPFPDLPRF